MATSLPHILTMSAVRKRSVKIGGHATSVSLEDGFWDALTMIAEKRGVTIASLIEQIDRDRISTNLSSGIRLFVLCEVRRPEFAGTQKKQMRGPVARSRREI